MVRSFLHLSGSVDREFTGRAKRNRLAAVFFSELLRLAEGMEKLREEVDRDGWLQVKMVRKGLSREVTAEIPRKRRQFRAFSQDWHCEPRRGVPMPQGPRGGFSVITESPECVATFSPHPIRFISTPRFCSDFFWVVRNPGTGYLADMN